MDPVVAVGFRDRGLDIVRRPGRDGVQPLRPVEGDPRNPAVAFIGKG